MSAVAHIQMSAGKIKRLHINQHVIKANRANGEDNPVITVKTTGGNDYGHEVAIVDDAGNEVARVIYRPDAPLDCGAHVWIETRAEIRVETR